MGELGAKDTDRQKPAQDAKESPLGKIKIELPNAASSSSCPFHNWFYIAVALFALSYAVYLQDRHVLLSHFAGNQFFISLTYVKNMKIPKATLLACKANL